MLNVDGGYLTFKMSFGSWDYWEMINGENVSILAWDNYTKRKEIHPQYKQHRKSDDPIIEDVRKLREEVYERTALALCDIPGCEADDIVACWNLFNPQDKIVGIDKDYFQLPSVYTVYHHDFGEYPLASMKIPKYLEELADKNFALYQMLLGDKADGIDRILSYGKEGKEQVQDCLKAIERNDLVDTLWNMFEDKIILNAKLVLFPYYEFGNWVSPEKEFFELWAAGGYYEKHHWLDFYDLILEKRRQPKYIQQSLFSMIV